MAGGEGPGAGGGGWVAGLGAADLGAAGLEALPHHRRDDLGSPGVRQARRTVRTPGEALHSRQGQAHSLGCRFGQPTVCQRSMKKRDKVTVTYKTVSMFCSFVSQCPYLSQICPKSRD